MTWPTAAPAARQAPAVPAPVPRVESITLREIRLALKEPFRISSGVQSHRRILLVRLAGEGIEGWGECVAGEHPNYSPENADTAWLAIREWLAPRLLGQRFAGPGEVWPVLDRNVRGHNMAKAALEMAAWDLAARAAETSLAELLGGVSRRIPVGVSLGIQESPAELAARAGAALDRGYRKIKLKIEPGSDVEFVRAVRRALGPDAPLMADANNAYRLEDAAHLAALDELDLLMIEQPLAWDDLLRHAELQRRLRTPICLDESISSPERAADMIELGAGRIVNIKPGRVGGFRQSLAIHDLCADHGVPVWCGGMLESGIGRGHNVALASLPNFTLPGDLSPSERYWERDVVEPEWTMDREGWVQVPRDRPGIGVTVDLARIEALTVRREELRA
ncbi:MAG TPA: o-succinylbenzoate synthase [Thermoanaerobaculia bacterium]|nr:o-succinylbenzoate synthase [Thermoanaerobaculia bacterium]